jgi:hypothetical protein
MPTQKISTKSAQRHNWGGQHGTDCDGWHLVKTPDLSVIEELTPANTSEARHSHVHARRSVRKFGANLGPKLGPFIVGPNLGFSGGKGNRLNRTFGRGGGDRTDDLFHAMKARSQPRHRPTIEDKKPTLAKSGSRQVPNSFSPLAFHADAPLYIPGAKTRIPAEPVTCEHICDSR